MGDLLFTSFSLYETEYFDCKSHTIVASESNLALEVKNFTLDS